MKKNPLGRGLESLIPTNKDIGKNNVVKEVDITDLVPNKAQPRKSFNQERLKELAESIKEKGIIQPIIVEKRGEKYTILAGERRWRAAGIAGLRKVPVIIKDNVSEQEKIEIGLIENIQREELNPVELALSYKTLLKEYGYTQEKLASIIGKSRVSITNSLRLLNLDERSLDALRKGFITEGHARALLSVDDLQVRLKILREIVEKKLSVRETEKLASKSKVNLTDKKEKIKREKDIFIKSLEDELKGVLQTKVDIKLKRNGGSITISFSNNDELDRIINILRGES